MLHVPEVGGIGQSVAAVAIVGWPKGTRPPSPPLPSLLRSSSIGRGI